MIFLFLFLGLFFGLNLISVNWLLFTLISGASLIFAYRRFNRKIALAFLIAFTLGIAYSFFNLRLNPSHGTYTGLIIESKANYYIVWVKFERLIVYENNHTHEVGDIIRLTGSINDVVDTSLESEFNFASFLFDKGIARQINVTASENIFTNFIRLKAYRESFLNLFSEGARDYIDAFLFNIKNYDSNAIKLASSLDITFLFSNAGLYLSLLFRGLEYLLFLKFSRRTTRISSLLILSWYLIFTLNRIGVRRILYLKIFGIINDYPLKKRFTYLEVLSLVGLVMLTFNHYLARQSAFYLGFLLSLVLLFVRNTLVRGKRWRIVSKSALFIFLFLLPVSLSSGHEFHVFALVFQIVLTPFTFFFALSGVISFYSYPIRPYFNFLAKGLDYTLLGLNRIDITLSFSAFSHIYLALYYFFLMAIIYFLESYQYRLVRILTALFTFTLLIPLIPYQNLYANSITFLNVGQGDSCLIRHFDKSIMIDTGGLTYQDIATTVTIPYLRKVGINHLDYVFISHSDYDHSGALNSLKANFPVYQVIEDSSPFIITIGDLSIRNLNKWSHLAKEENDRSQVLNFRIANRNVLMMGDASSNIENYLLHEYDLSALKIDLLKLGHHGSKTSSSRSFLNAVKPKEAIISVGKKNKYGHPNQEVLDSLKALNIPYKRTDEIGTISYYANRFFKA